MNIFLFLSVALLLTLVLGHLLERIRIPWIFSALFLGLVLSLHNPVPEIIESEVFRVLADLGMYFLLFLIGLEIDVREIGKQGMFIAKLSLSLVLAESVLGAVFIHYAFGMPWVVAILTASSFATVGEAILIPILDEFKILKTRFGQILLGVGTLDDIIELVTIVFVSVLLGYSADATSGSLVVNFLLLGSLFFVPFFLQFFRSHIHRLKFQAVPPLFLFGLVVLFVFIGIGSLVESAALAAVLAGLALRNLIAEERIEQFEETLRIVGYGFFVPLFFLQVGATVHMSYLFAAPLLIVLVLLITKLTKIVVSLLLARKKLGGRKALLLGVGLSAKFSTSIVIITILHGQGIIPLDLYSVLIGAMIVSKFLIPLTFSLLLTRWNMDFERV